MHAERDERKKEKREEEGGDEGGKDRAMSDEAGVITSSIWSLLVSLLRLYGGLNSGNDVTLYEFWERQLPASGSPIISTNTGCDFLYEKESTSLQIANSWSFLLSTS